MWLAIILGAHRLTSNQSIRCLSTRIEDLIPVKTPRPEVSPSTEGELIVKSTEFTEEEIM